VITGRTLKNETTPRSPFAKKILSCSLPLCKGSVLLGVKKTLVIFPFQITHENKQRALRYTPAMNKAEVAVSVSWQRKTISGTT